MKRWHWRDQEVSWSVLPDPGQRADTDGGDAADTGDHAMAVVLVHGFGACKEHWRHNQPVLGSLHRCYAIDLVGFGASSKPRSRLAGEPEVPGDFRYGLEVWAEQVSAFCREVVSGPVTLVGNSIGGVVVLRAAQMLAGDPQAPCRRVVLVDAAQRAMDDKRLQEMPLPVRAIRPLLRGLVSQRWLTERLFRWFARPALIRRVLLMAYPSGANVDDALVELIHRATRDAGAPESFRGFINLFDDHLAPQLLADLQVPVHMIWGEADPWEPVAVSRDWQRFACVRSFEALPGLGHCPHDEAPEQVNPLLLRALTASD
ncbi:alpha/beta fold hydrolase [Synechococcus sp. RSCCF101]|uniref:alpha/beta fold hydrolase n=1 Tax=Synechococcus sp. RSCCF101 TaxID=2511069 RepID=UPI0012465B5F|nr:alpha/beta fold hydrolase [Synechococcus sp. RSCCF101]QEY32505.1 alpha/beta fold hydrolase [Synechococcus sp. RSCCF101]